MNFYEALKISTELYKKRVVNIYSFSNKQNLDKLEIIKSYDYLKTLLDNIDFSKEEEKYIRILYGTNRVLSTIFDSWGKNEVYNFFIPGFNIDIEKNVYSKLMVLECLGLLDCDNNFISNCIKYCATEELRKDQEFLNLAITLNGKYFRGFSDEIKNYQNTMIAIANDKDDIPMSFLDAPLELKIDYNLALLYIEKLNKVFSVDSIYNNLLKYTEKSEFLYPHNNKFIGKNDSQIQRYWLSNPLFIAGLSQINQDFNDYIMDYKIIKYGSNLEPIEEINEKKKGIIRR